MNAEVVIAVRGGPGAKSRCAGALPPEARERLVEAMLADMLEAARAASRVDAVHVVTPTASLAEAALERGAKVVPEGDPAGLNAAFERARSEIAARGDALLMLLPGDLPALEGGELDRVIAAWRPGSVVLTPAQADGGTGAVVMQAASPLAISFGPDSFRRHQAAARGAGLAVEVVESPSLAFDLDRPADVEPARKLPGRTGALLRELSARYEAMR